jgi:hypothetical protein
MGSTLNGSINFIHLLYVILHLNFFKWFFACVPYYLNILYRWYISKLTWLACVMYSKILGFVIWYKTDLLEMWVLGVAHILVNIVQCFLRGVQDSDGLGATWSTQLKSHASYQGLLSNIFCMGRNHSPLSKNLALQRLIEPTEHPEGVCNHYHRCPGISNSHFSTVKLRTSSQRSWITQEGIHWYSM